ncbi:cytochrome P450 [Vogesella indigofera]|uniref:cytochrome P450 n=1 Tax=Vogesella indigofera TaxID=45465 RepID=UPI00234FAD3C|nr:cytochrome P450 [Vogesella indigofera]MDC7710857.1 cytochrome P450 [Vogesella indigofera]
MSKFCPVYPKPAKSRASLLWMFFRKRHSWLSGLFERSYHMKMGHVHLPGLDLYMINEPSLVRKVLIEQAERFPKHALLDRILKPLLGSSIFTTNGETWQRQRSMMDEGFEHARLKTVFPLMNAAAQAMLDRLDTVADGRDYDIDIEMTHVTADIIFRTIMSVPLEGEDAKKIFEAFLRFQEMAPRIALPIMYKLPRWMTPWLDSMKSRKAAEEIRSLLATFIRPRFDAHRSGIPSEDQDILAALLDAKDKNDGTGFSFEELLDQIAMLFLAGHETSASALAWAHYLMTMSPEVQERMHEEVVAVAGERELMFTDIKKLELVGNVMKETLRLYPPVGFFAREATEATLMRNKKIKPGASIMISPWLTHRHRKLWERPDEFDPDRYQTDASRESLRCAYMPFGQGPRVCIGAAFAMQEAVLILAQLVRRYRFTTIPGYQPEPVGRLTIRSDNGICLRIERRQIVPSQNAASSLSTAFQT